jgi:hypothetical protein
MFIGIVNQAGMEHSFFLRQYKYEIPGSPVNAQPALRAFFDFEHGGFQLESDNQYIVNTNTKNKKSWPRRKSDRFFVEANMKPEIPSGPDDNLHNELLLNLNGTIHYGKRKFKCSGLLILNRNLLENKTQWTIYCNLMDVDLDIFEIKLKVPVFTGLAKTASDN